MVAGKIRQRFFPSRPSKQKLIVHSFHPCFVEERHVATLLFTHSFDFLERLFNFPTWHGNSFQAVRIRANKRDASC